MKTDLSKLAESISLAESILTERIKQGDKTMHTQIKLLDFKSKVTNDYKILDIEKGEDVFVPITTLKQAEFIVTACNAHEELIEALKTMVEHAQETYPHFESIRGQFDIKCAKEALAKAGVKV